MEKKGTFQNNLVEGKGTLQRSREGCCVCEARKKVKAVLWGERGHLKKRFTFEKRASILREAKVRGTIVCGQKERGGEGYRKEKS